MRRWAIPFILITIGMIGGWLFPVEGPYDYLYDRYASQPAHSHPRKVAPYFSKQITVDITELSLDDLELLEDLFEKSKGYTDE